MQHIGLRIENEQGKILNDVSMELNYAELLKLILQKSGEDYEVLTSKYPWLTSIDIYGSTYLNHLQIPYLLNELNEISKTLDLAEKTYIKLFINFLTDESITKNRLLVKFIGD